VAQIDLRAEGDTHQGNVREANEDALLVDPELGLYAVLDGMGGHMAGDVASSTARDVIHEFARSRRQAMAPKELVSAAINAASAAVHSEARRTRDRHGMGTTVVACLIADPAADQPVAVFGHVGDSRAYLLRDKRMRQLTADHTVVAELIANGAISPEEAVHHPYKSVLSRNLGSKPEARVDLLELPLKAGDRLLLCSDGLSGFASTEAIEQILDGAENPQAATQDLIDAALRGGGGDNVSVLVIEAGKKSLPRSTQIIRTSGAVAWWQRRADYLDAARARGLASSPICSVLSQDEALEIVAGNLCEAIYHDLEQTTGVNVWTYAENLGNGWLDQEGPYEVLRDLLDILRGAALDLIASIAASGEQFAGSLEIAVTRSFVVAEMAVGGLLADRLRVVEADLVKQHTAMTTTQRTFTEQPTIPYMPAARVDPPRPAVATHLDEAFLAAQAALATLGEKKGAAECLERAHQACLESEGVADAVLAARELYVMYANEEGGEGVLLDALDQARAVHLEAVRKPAADFEVKAAATRRVSIAHRKLFFSATGLIIEAGHPVSEQLQTAAEETARLRTEVGEGEAKLAAMERKLVSSVGRSPLDPNQTEGS